jgi:hypothetical protein
MEELGLPVPKTHALVLLLAALVSHAGQAEWLTRRLVPISNGRTVHSQESQIDWFESSRRSP